MSLGSISIIMPHNMAVLVVTAGLAHANYYDSIYLSYDDAYGDGGNAAQVKNTGVETKYPDCHGIIAYIGDGWCDTSNNVPSCGYDGGDCCFCTCGSTGMYECGVAGYSCVDPEGSSVEGCTSMDEHRESSQYDELSLTAQFPNCTGVGILSLIGDGWCDEVNNGESCDYDGGDCCYCTCVSTASITCGSGGFFCADPDGFNVIGCDRPDDYVALYNVDDAYYGKLLRTLDDYPDCEESIILVGDGLCDNATNVESCGYDGRNCCFCASVYADPYSLPLYNFDCRDPDAGSIDNLCNSLQSAVLPCAPDVETKWVVDDSDKASFLAQTIYCSGGKFEVEWIGAITVSDTIYVVDGTVLSVMGIAEEGSSAVADGGGINQVFIVMNASLYVTDLQFTNCSGRVGGAIAASNSTLTFQNTEFWYNNANFGGALFSRESSTVSWSNSTAFLGNSAEFSGGAIFMANGSSISWSGRTDFSGNTAIGYGGVTHVRGTSNVSWSGGTTFSNNSASYGGALSIFSSKGVEFDGDTTFARNSANWGDGGAIFIGSSSIRMVGTTIFQWNLAASSGGAIGSSSSESDSDDAHLLISDSAYFSHNECGMNGGAMSLLSGLEVNFSGAEMKFENNSAFEHGGAIYVIDEAVGPQFRGTRFASNTAGNDGGAVYAEASGVLKNGGTYENPTVFIGCWFSENNASGTGGAIYSTFGVDDVFDSHFYSNTAAEGGALRLAGRNGVVRNCTFVENSSGEDQGPAVYHAGTNLKIEECEFRDNYFLCSDGQFRDTEEVSMPADILLSPFL